MDVQQATINGFSANIVFTMLGKWAEGTTRVYVSAVKQRVKHYPSEMEVPRARRHRLFLQISRLASLAKLLLAGCQMLGAVGAMQSVVHGTKQRWVLSSRGLHETRNASHGLQSHVWKPWI